ncbi:hypothetical protein ACK3TF_006061 [Chlorella vulgaris]
MERADVQQEAAPETASPQTVERHREQHRIQIPSCLSPRDPRLQVYSPADTQPSPTPAQPLLPGSAADASDSGSPVLAKSEQPEGSEEQVPPAQAASSEEQQEAEERSQQQCSHCGSPNPGGEWQRYLCDACGQYARRNDGRLPSAAVLQRREQQRQVAAASKERHVPPSQRQCLQCSASTPGVRRHWVRHPATKEGWLCHKCYHCTWKQLKRKRQREAAEGGCCSASGSDSGKESGQEDEEAQPPSQSAASPQQQAAPVQPSMPDLPIQQQAPAYVAAELFAGARQQQQPQGVNPDATWETAPEQPALLPAQPPQPQASTGLLVLEAAQQAAAAAAGLTEGLAGTFAELLPMPAEQDECLRLMLQHRQYSGAAGLMRALLHMRGIPPLGLPPACPDNQRGLGCEGAAEAGFTLLGAFEPRHPRPSHLLSPSIERLVRAGAGMERADVQQGAALETAAPPTDERQQEQQRIQVPSCLSPRDPRLRQLSSPADTQPSPTPAQPLHPGIAADASDSGSPVSAESEQGQPEGSNSQMPRPQVAGSGEQQTAEEQSQRQCSHCGSPRSTAKWRRHSTTRARLCSACGQYERKNNGRLPSAAVLQRREQQRHVVAASKERHVPPSQRRCLQCGTRTPGAQWNRHPATKEEWLCHSCYHCAWKELKRKRQREAAEGGCSSASGSDSGEESGQEGEEAQPPSQSAASPQQQAAPVQPSMPGPPRQQRVPATVAAGRSADPREQQQGVSPDATWETAPEQPALLPARPPQPQASTGLLVLEAAQLASAAAAGLTEGLAGSFAALLPMPAEQDECLRLMLKRRQYSGAAGLMRALLHMRCILPAGVHPACPERRFALLCDFRRQLARSCHLLRPTIERLVRAGAGMERVDVQQEAALDTAAPPTVERQREQQRIQAPSHIRPSDPRLRQLSSPVDTQPSPIPAQPLLPGSAAAAASDSGSPVSGDRKQAQPDGSEGQMLRSQFAGGEEQQAAEQQSQRQCSHCGSPHSAAKWRRHSTTRARLCSACGQYETKNDGRLPSAAVLQRRAQKRLAVPSSQRQCMQCGASTPGVRRHWVRHPATNDGWLCDPCYQREFYQLKRKRQREAVAGGCSSGSGSDGGAESGQEGEEAQPPSQSAAAPQPQAAPVQPPMPGPPGQQRARATAAAELCAGARQQQQQPQGVNPDATWETAPEQPALLPAQPPQPQASTGLLVLEAAQQAAAEAAGLTEGLAGAFAALLPMPAEQDECLRLMLQHRQYSGAAALMRALLHMRGIPPPGLPPAPSE